MLRWVLLAAAAVALASCATPYQEYSLLPGLNAWELRPDVYRVSLQGNGFTSTETLQVYWLNRCAELAIEKGYAGFETLSDMKFVMRHPPDDDAARTRLASSVASLRTQIPVSTSEVADVSVWREQRSLASRSDEPIRLAHGGVMIFYGGGTGLPLPKMEGDVHFLSQPVESAPPKIFNAKALLAQLEPLMKGEKCAGNICPHVHEYLLPKGKLK